MRLAADRSPHPMSVTGAPGVAGFRRTIRAGVPENEALMTAQCLSRKALAWSLARLVLAYLTKSFFQILSSISPLACRRSRAITSMAGSVTSSRIWRAKSISSDVGTCHGICGPAQLPGPSRLEASRTLTSLTLYVLPQIM